MTEKKFKEKYRTAVCYQCYKRYPCAEFNSICTLVTPCAVCEIKDSCSKVCEQMESFIQRGNPKDNAIPFSRLKLPTASDSDMNPQSRGWEGILDFLTIQDEKNKEPLSGRGAIFSSKHIPWGAISEIAELYLVEHFINNKTYDEIALKYNVKSSVVYHTIHGGKNRTGALKTLKKYTILRQLFILQRHKLPKQLKKILWLHLFKFKTHSEIAKITGYSRGRITQLLRESKILIQKLTNRRV